MILAALSSQSQKPPDRFKTAEEFAHDRLREMILSGELAGGTRLNQNDLASRLGISRMPVRQAILRLESEGLVVQRPNRGATVVQLGPSAILELFEMRSVLEGLALRLAVPRMTPDHHKEVERRIVAMDEVQSDVDTWIARHEALHDFLCDCAGRARLAAAVRHLRHSVTPYIRLYLNSYKRAEMSGFEHHALLRAIETGDPIANEAIMREHVMSAAQGVVDFVEARSKPSVTASGDANAQERQV